MTTHIDPEDHEYSYINDGYRYTETPDKVSHYEHLRKDRQENHGKPTTETKATVQPPAIEPPSRTDSHTSCKKPPWWVWLLVVIGLLIIGGLAALIYFVLQILPHQGNQESSMSTMTSSTSSTISPDISTSTAAPIPTGPLTADCQALYSSGHTSSGVYTISPDGVTRMTVYCEQRLDGGGWTVIQRRLNGNVTFDRLWNDYKLGFGDASGDFWLGNDNIHALTAGRDQKLKIEMEYPATNLVYADYLRFETRDESDKYRLLVSGFSTYDGIHDEFGPASGSQFSTEDQDNDTHFSVHCAQLNHGGWWYHACSFAKLNGRFSPKDQYEAIRWLGLTPPGRSLVSVRMMAKGA